MSTTTSQQYLKTLFPQQNLDWKLIYLLPQVLTKNTSLTAFQYKVLNNVLYLKHKHFQFLCIEAAVKRSSAKKCSYDL